MRKIRKIKLSKEIKLLAKYFSTITTNQFSRNVVKTELKFNIWTGNSSKDFIEYFNRFK